MNKMLNTWLWRNEKITWKLNVECPQLEQEIYKCKHMG